MSSGHHPTDYHLNDALEYHTPGREAIGNAPIHDDALDLEHFMMSDHHPHSRAPSVVNTPQLDLHQNQHHHHQFGDFSLPYSNISDTSMPLEHQIGSHSHPYTVSGHDPNALHRNSVSSIPDHQNPIASMPGDHRHSVAAIPAHRASFSSAQGRARHNSGSGLSEMASPDFGLLGKAVVDSTDMGPKPKAAKSNATPAWTEMKTKAGKERKRLPLACIACRRKKIRCSGEKPSCKHCVRARIPCVYKVTTRKAAPRTDYMAMLDKRLKRMEDRIIKIVPIDEQAATTASVARANVKPSIPSLPPVDTKKRGRQEAFVPNFDEWSSTLSAASIDAAKPPSLMIQEAEESKLLAEGAEILPSKEIQEHLAEVFFENINGQTYSLLHKPSYMRKLRSGNLPPVLILAVCAVSARFSTHPKLNTQPAFLRGEEWASKARDIVMGRYEWPNITILTCLLILGLHEFGTCQGGRSWSLGGQAIRMAYALQLHKDLDYDPQKRNGTVELSFIDREIRRRIMWSCFLMDRFNSSGTDRPIFIKEETIKIQLPIREKFFQLDMPGPTEDLTGHVPHAIPPGAGQLSDARDNMGVAAYMIRSIALWGRIINYLNLGGKEQDTVPMWHPESQYTFLLKETENFDNSLPDSLKYNQENLRTHQTEGLDNQFLFLHISHQQNILFMNRFAVPDQPNGRPPNDVPKDFTTQAGARAFRSANRISDILYEASSHFVTAPFAGYCAFLSSTVHIFGVFSKNQAMEEVCKKNLAINVTYITKMKKYWGMFHWMAENLKDQYRFFADVTKRGASVGGVTQSATSLFQYGDWFKRYPHGVSQSDYEDPLGGILKEKGDDAVLEQKSDYATVEEFFNTLPPLPPRASSIATKQNKNSRAKRQKTDQPGYINTESQETSQQLKTRDLQEPQPHSQQFNNEFSPNSLVDLYSQPFPTMPQDSSPANLNQHALMPQLDRQFVFGAYANMDPSSLSSHTILDSAQSWNINMSTSGDGTNGDGSSAWFMPFNMIPPEISGEGGDIFGSFTNSGVYGDSAHTS